MKALTVFVSGLLFAAGLVIAGMTLPEKVIGFLDFFGDWDPSLAFVMGGAILVHFPAYLYIKRKQRPMMALSFAVPSRRDIDARLIAGAAIFGIGWGLGGFCPGPGLTSLVSLSPAAIVFVVAMVLGMTLYTEVDQVVTSRKSKSARRCEPVPIEVEVQGG